MSGPNEVPEQNRVHIFDTTLRDGEQSPGISLNTQEKVEIAQQLARLGVDVIEAGFPITSPGDFEAVEAIARNVEGPVICGLARTHKADIDAAWGAIKDSQRPRIHTFISTSDIHIEHQLQTTREDVKGQAKAAVALAKSYCEDVEFSPMDATRAESSSPPRSARSRSPRARTSINIPDTVGYTTPEEYTRYFERLYELAPELRDVRLSVHCHDDLGLAVANSYAGLLAGARQVECAVNGIGERAGNCSLEEIVVLLRTRTRRARPRHRPQHARARADEPHGHPLHRLPGAAEQGGRRAQRVRARVGHPPGRRAQGADDVRVDPGRGGRRRARGDRARQALRSPRAARRARAARLQGRGQRAQRGLQAVQGDRGQEEAGDCARPRGDRLRPAARVRAALRARLVRRRGVVAARAARQGRGRAPVGRGDRRPSRAATGRSTRSSARSRPRSTPSASCASTPSPR